MNKPLALASLCLATAAAACSDGSTAGVSIAALSRAGGEPVTHDVTGATFTLTRGTLAVRDIELYLPSGVKCSDVGGDLVGATCKSNDDPAGDDSTEGDKVFIDGPFVVDLLTGTATPSLADVRIPATTYTRVDVRVDPSASLGDASFVIEASFDLGGQPSTFAATLRFGEDIRVDDPAGIALAADEDLVTRFIVDDWLAGVDVAACARALGTAPGGTVSVDDRSSGACASIDDQVKDNMKRSGDLDSHGDDDGPNHQ